MQIYTCILGVPAAQSPTQDPLMDHAAATPKSLFKRIIRPLVSVPVYDFWCRQFGSTHAWSRCHARVVARSEAAQDTVTLRLLPNANFDGFKPGQHVNVTADIRGRRVTRSYSFSHVPNDRRWVEITVRRYAQGVMSQWLAEHASPGVVLELGRVFGDMTIECYADRPLLFVAGGSGITPLMSLLREQAAKGMPQPLTLVYFENSESQFCFSKELDELAKRFSNFTWHAVATHGDRSRRISAHTLNELGVSADGAQVLTCGSGAFVAQVKATTEGVASSVHFEAFTQLPAKRTEQTARTVTVDLTLSQRRIEVSSAESLLAGLERQGVQVHTGCRMGVCNTCSCQKLGGHTNAIDGTDLDTNMNSQIRLCVTRAASNVQLAL